MIKTIKHYMRVTWENIRISILTTLEYPTNLLGWLLSNPIQFLVGFATIKFVVAEFGSINGWNYGQLAFLYGLAIISHALSMIFFVQGWFMGSYVVYGDFDRYMLRPMSVLYQFFFTGFNVIGITDLIPGICVFAYGCIKVGFVFSLYHILAILSLLTGAVLIRGGVYLIIGTTSFYTKSINDYGAYTQELFDKTTMYPLSMYPESIQFILTYLIPIGWVSFYPAAELLGIGDGRSAGQGAVWITLAVGILVFILAGLYFYRGLRSYESAGN
ncbi:MAG: ABC-2 family transporter protein [Lachnospiraceae bacterium]|nr:ABC-2 family transporter protein [Lachnospiraceae bacterium]